LHLIILGAKRVHGQGNRLYFAYEPLYLIREGARVARAASTLYAAIRITDLKKRMLELSRIIQMNHETATGYGNRDSGEVDREIEMNVLEVPIGFHIQPRTPMEWTIVGVNGLSNLTDNYLSSEFLLSWMEPTLPSRNITNGWKVRSLLGALFFKMAHQLSTRRYCRLCSKPLSNRARSDAQVCSSTCRKQLNRKKRRVIEGSPEERRVSEF
jgi:predicted nucleic acid-binding Zn ribbon protein